MTLNKKSSWVFSFVLILSACGVEQPVNINTEVSPFVELFESRHKKPVNISITLVELEEGVLGTCTMYSSGLRYIELSTRYWKSLSYNAREQLVLHELGHCILNRQHNVYLTNFRPVSIMYPYGFGESSWYSQFKESYLYELFNPSSQLRTKEHNSNIDVVIKN